MTYELFFDTDLLSELVGEPVKASRLRWKPGLSTQAALHRADGSIYGWAQSFTPAHADKAKKALIRSERYGKPVTVKEVPGADHKLVFGPPESDLRLIKAFHQLAKTHLNLSDLRLKRFNPARRAVYRATLDGEEIAVRLHSDPADAEGADDRSHWLLGRGIKTAAPMSHLEFLTLWPWVGETDLESIEGEDRRRAAKQAGELLAEVHALNGSGDLPTKNLRDAVVAQAQDIGRLDADLGARALEIAERCQWPDLPLVAAHGDFSADQVAVGGDEAWLLDFDRLQRLPLPMDFASFHACELLNGFEPVTDAVLEGHGGITMDEVRPYVAIALGQRAFEPFRAADLNWREAMHARLDQMEEWL